MTSTEWNAAIDAALAKVREQRAVFSSDAYATPQPIGGFMERFACNSIEVEIEALRKPDTPPTPAAEEREALGATVSAFWDTKDTVESCINAVLSALAPYRAAEILAAEANERARIVAWLRATSTGLDLTKRRIADAIERNEHGADTNKQSGVPVPSNHEGVNLVALCLAMARIKELNTALNGIVPSPLCGESWNLPDKETVQITVTFGALKAARLALTNSINVATS